MDSRGLVSSAFAVEFSKNPRLALLLAIDVSGFKP